MKNETTTQMTRHIVSLVKSLGMEIDETPVERWEGDGVFHLFTGNACIEYCGVENAIFDCTAAASVIITGNENEDHCEILRKNGVWKEDGDFVMTFTSYEKLKETLLQVKPFI